MLSRETTDQINKKADDFGFQVPYDGTENFYDKGRVEGYQAGATSWAVWKETAEVLAEALDYLMDGVSGLPALTAIEGVLIPHWNKAVDARSKYKNKQKSSRHP